MSPKFCIIIESNSQKTFFVIGLYTNMAAVTSRENREYSIHDPFVTLKFVSSQSEDSEEGEDWQETESDSSLEVKGLQYLYIQMEYCEKSTLRNLIDEGLHQDEECVWRLFREIVEGLAHIHTQVIVFKGAL